MRINHRFSKALFLIVFGLHIPQNKGSRPAHACIECRLRVARVAGGWQKHAAIVGKMRKLNKAGSVDFRFYLLEKVS